jgi:hypothetical protein
MRVQHTARPVQERTPQFEGRSIEGDGSHQEEGLARAQLDILDIIEQADDGAVRSHDGLGSAGGT